MAVQRLFIILRPRGLQGELKVFSDLEQPQNCKDQQLSVRSNESNLPETVRVVSARWIGNKNCSLRIEGVNSISEAEQWNGVELWGNLDDVLPALQEKDTFYIRDLIGLTVRIEGIDKGKIDDVLETERHPVLIATIEDEERLIPFIEQFVPHVDVANGFVEVIDFEVV